MSNMPGLFPFRFRPFRRSPKSVLKAAGYEVDLGNDRAIQGVLSRRQEWQRQAFDAAEAVGEVNLACVDEETEALTLSGWKSYDELLVGDVILSYDHNEGVTRWEPIQHLLVRPALDEEVLSVEGSFHSSLTTLDHRWPVTNYLQRRRKDNHGWTKEWVKEWTTSAGLKQNHSFHLAAPCEEIPGEPKWSDDFVSLVAWFWTEGHIHQNPGQTSQRISISQSITANGPYVAEISQVLSRLFGPSQESLRTGAKRGDAGWRIGRANSHGVVGFFLNTDAAEQVLQVAPNKRVSLDFIQSLTRSQLELFIRVSMKADGHNNLIHQKYPDMLDGLEMAAILAGYSTHRYVMPGNTRKHHLNIRERAMFWPLANMRRRDGLTKTTRYTGTVWCPTVASSAWVARRRGCVFFTGNCNIVADLMSRLTFYVAEVPDNQDADPKRTKDTDAINILERLGSPVARAELQRDLSIQLLVTGEGYLCGIQPADGRSNTEEVWFIASIDEVETATISGPEGSIPTITLTEWNDDLSNFTLDPSKGDTFIRIYRRSNRRRQRATSHVRSILGAADELTWWDAASIAYSKSRLAGPGLLAIPSNMELPSESDDDAALTGTMRLVKKLFNTAIQAMQNPGEASNAVPIFVTYPANDKGVSGIEHITMDRPQDDLLEARTDRSIRRISQGLPIPVEDIFGLGSSSHLGAGQIEASKFRQFVEPFAVLMANGLTTAFFAPIAAKSGIPTPSKYLIWYDASNLITYPDTATQSNRGIELGGISLRSWRRANGYSDADAPTEEEKAELLEWLATVRRGTDKQGIVEDPQAPVDPDDPNAPPVANPPGKRTPEDQPSAPLRRKGQPVLSSANGHTTSDLGRKLAEIDADLFTRIQVMCDSSMRRALDTAGNKLRSRARKNPAYRATLRNVTPEDVAATLGRDTVITLGTDDLFTEAFDDIPARFEKWCSLAADMAFQSASIPSKPSPEAWSLNYAPDEAAAKLVKELKELAATLLFDCTASLVAEPEADYDLLVPAGMVRRAISRAGGTPLDANPTTLIATGRTVSKVLAEAGYYAKSFTWSYGTQPRQPFTSHQHLDGTEFQMTGSMVPGSDTEHCRCVGVPQF